MVVQENQNCSIGNSFGVATNGQKLKRRGSIRAPAILTKGKNEYEKCWMYRRSGRFLRVEGDFGLDQLLARWRSSARHGCFGSGATARAGRRNGGGGEKGEAGFQVGFFFRYQQEARVGIGQISPLLHLKYA